MGREHFSAYARHRSYTAGLETAAAAVGEPVTEDPLFVLTHKALAHRLNAQLHAAQDMLRTMEQDPRVQKELAQLLAPITASIHHIARTQEDPRAMKMELHKVIADYTQEPTHTPTFSPFEQDALKACAAVHLHRQHAIYKAQTPVSLPENPPNPPPQPRPSPPRKEPSISPEQTSQEPLSDKARLVLAAVRNGVPIRASDVRQILQTHGALAGSEWEELASRSGINHFTKARQELDAYFAARGIGVGWEESGNSSSKEYAFSTNNPKKARPIIAQALQEECELGDMTPKNLTTRELIRIMASGHPVSVETIRDVLFQTNAIEPRRWLDHSHAVTTYYLNEVVVHLAQRGIPVDYDYQGRGPARTVWLMHSDGSSLTPLSPAFWETTPTNQADKPSALANSNQPQPKEAPNAAVPPTAIPHPSESTTVPTSSDASAEPQGASVQSSTEEPPKKGRDTSPSHQADRPPLGDVARTILKQTRALMNPGLASNRRNVSMESVIETLRLNHPGVDVHAILQELVGVGELHVIEVDGETRILPGARPAPQYPHKIRSRFIQPPSFHEVSQTQYTNHLLDNSDIVAAVIDYLASANGDASAHQLTRVYKAVGSELERRDFFFLLQQMEEAGTIVRSRAGEEGPYVAHLVAQSQ